MTIYVYEYAQDHNTPNNINYTIFHSTFELLHSTIRIRITIYRIVISITIVAIYPFHFPYHPPSPTSLPITSLDKL